MKASKKELILIAIFLISTMFTMMHFHCFQRESGLIDLQKAILTAKVDATRQKILGRLDQYYLNASIPDSIKQIVQVEVESLLRCQENNSPVIKSINSDTAIYQLENWLTTILRDAIIARVRNDSTLFQRLIPMARTLAEIVDLKTCNDHWCSWVAKVQRFDGIQAMNWLSSYCAERLCYRHHLTAFKEAEQLGAFGLQLLQHSDDIRLRLDISQRLITILYQYHGLYDLSFYYAQREFNKADAAKYHLRAIGILYNYAEALHNAGMNEKALETFEEIISRAENYRQIPMIDWYKKNALLGMARSNWQLGNYHKALNLCAKVETLDLGPREKILLHITRGIVYRTLGDYEGAIIEYTKSLSLSKYHHDIANQIQVLRNLGTIYFRLSEYDKADAYYNEALSLLLTYFPENSFRRGELLICLAENYQAQNKIEACNEFVHQVNDLIIHLSNPVLRAELLRSLGRLNMNLHHYQQAQTYFQRSLSIYEDYGLFRAVLETKTDLGNCLLCLSNYGEAQQLLDHVYLMATQIQDLQHKIDALGLMAELAEKQRQIDKAVLCSNQLMKEVELLGTRFSNVDNLTAFFQKIHNYLKKAVIYDLRLGNIDSAFVKLDYLKAQALKRRLGINKNGRSNFSSSLPSTDVNIFKRKLTKNQLLINYLVTKDTLYAFVLNAEKLELLKRTIDINYLKQLTTGFLNLIDKTIKVYHNNQAATFIEHYDSTMITSQNLFQYLLGWPKLKTYLQDTDILYIIPDDVLYEIPFSCLMAPKDMNSEFLIQKTAIINLPCAVFLQQQGNHLNQDFGPQRMLVSINRSFRYANELIRYIKRSFPFAEELVIDRPETSKDDILSKLNRHYDTYIFVGHSVADVKFPDSSYFEFTGINQLDHNKTIPIKLTLADLKSIDWSTAKVILIIGCETAHGKPYRGTGLAGIQQCILTLGGQQILASIWRIDGDKANLQILGFLKAWIRNRHAAIALQSIQKELIQDLTNDPYYKKPHPYFWGWLTLSQVGN